jgi:D-alanyl-D-alanine carboxypeptidase (penicillin-binding protein 5/6)
MNPALWRSARVACWVAVTAALLALAPDRVRAAVPLPVITAPEAIVVDGWTGAVLYAKHANTPRYPARTVKLTTALVLLDHHASLDRIVTVSANAASYGGSTAGLWAGERLSIRDLLHGMLLPSGNDAAIALAESFAGTAERFVALMNAEAARLQLRHTHYLTPNGFDVYGQVTTARDLATVARADMRYPVFAGIVRSRWWGVRAPGGGYVHQWFNLNHLLWSNRFVDGVKTGTTPLAGACLVSSARRGGRWVIAVNMGSTEASRWSDGLALLNYGLSQVSTLPSA